MVKKVAFIGTSVPMLFYVYQFSKKNSNCKIFIYENRDTVGGAWFTISNKYASNIDHGLHYISSTTNNIKLYQNLFAEFNITIKQVEFYKNNLSNLKCILYAENGWGALKDHLVQNLIHLGVTFIKQKVDSIVVKCNKCILNIESIYNKVFLPAYVDIEKVEVNKEVIQLESSQMTTIHVLLFLKCNNIKCDENYHAILKDSEEFYYDRIMFVADKKHFKTEETNLVAYLRVSRSFKQRFRSLNYIQNALDFLNEKDLLSKDAKLVHHTVTEYSYPFRRDKVKSLQKQINNCNIEMLDTRTFETVINLCLKKT